MVQAYCSGYYFFQGSVAVASTVLPRKGGEGKYISKTSTGGARAIETLPQMRWVGHIYIIE